MLKSLKTKEASQNKNKMFSNVKNYVQRSIRKLSDVEETAKIISVIWNEFGLWLLGFDKQSKWKNNRFFDH